MNLCCWRCVLKSWQLLNLPVAIRVEEPTCFALSKVMLAVWRRWPCWTFSVLNSTWSCVKSPVVVIVAGLLFHKTSPVCCSGGTVLLSCFCHFSAALRGLQVTHRCFLFCEDEKPTTSGRNRWACRCDAGLHNWLQWVSSGLWKSLVFIRKEGPYTSEIIIPSKNAVQDFARGRKEPSELLVLLLVNVECPSEQGGFGDTTGGFMVVCGL